jgi:hypothetical protein
MSGYGKRKVAGAGQIRNFAHLIAILRMTSWENPGCSAISPVRDEFRGYISLAIHFFPHHDVYPGCTDICWQAYVTFKRNVVMNGINKIL